MKASKEKNREYQAKWYLDNKEAHSSKQREQKQLKRLFLIALKENYPCTDCGKFFYYCQMHFDHLRDKSFNVGMAYRNYGWDKLVEEINKCELVCANCHALRTYKRMQM